MYGNGAGGGGIAHHHRDHICHWPRIKEYLQKVDEHKMRV